MARKFRCKCCGTVKVVNKTSGYIGVYLYAQNNKWRARATDENGSVQSLGYFNNEKEAAIVYDNFIIDNKIVNRPLNFPNRVCSESV